MLNAVPSTQKANRTERHLICVEFLRSRSHDTLSYSVRWSLGWSLAKHGSAALGSGCFLAHSPTGSRGRKAQDMLVGPLAQKRGGGGAGLGEGCVDHGDTRLWEWLS